MAWLNRRDLVGLAALAVGVAVTAAFFLPGTGTGAKIAIDPGQVIPTATPTPRGAPTPTPLPMTAIAQPTEWSLVYYRSKQPGSFVDTRLFPDRLDIAFPRSPFNDIPDDNWSVGAYAEVPVAVGNNTFTLVHQGQVRVLRDGVEVANEPGGSAPRELQVTITAERPGRVAISIEGVDTGGPFLLRWK